MEVVQAVALCVERPLEQRTIGSLSGRYRVLNRNRFLTVEGQGGPGRGEGGESGGEVGGRNCSEELKFERQGGLRLCDKSLYMKVLEICQFHLATASEVVGGSPVQPWVGALWGVGNHARYKVDRASPDRLNLVVQVTSWFGSWKKGYETLR